MNRRSILAAYKKKSSHLQTGVTGFKSGNLFNLIIFFLCGPLQHPFQILCLYDFPRSQSFLLAVPLFQKTAYFLKIIKEQNRINRNASAATMFPVIPNQCSDNILRRFCPCKKIFFADIQRFGYFFGSALFGRSES